MNKLSSSKLRAGFVPLLLLLGIVAVLLLLGLTVFGPWELPGLGQLSLRQQAQKSEAALPDTDGDGFSDSIETYLGTDPARDCPTTESPNDENVDAWPPDFNDNRTIAIDDTNAVTSRFNKKAVGEHRRYDLNGDGWIRVDDIYAVSSRFNQKCTYYPYKLTATPSGSQVTFNWLPGIESAGVYLGVHDMTQSGRTECNLATLQSNAINFPASDMILPDGTSPSFPTGTTSYSWSSALDFIADPIQGHKYCSALWNLKEGLSNFVNFTIPSPIPLQELSTLKVSSSGVVGVPIVGSKSGTSGTTNYTITINGDFNTTLTAPAIAQNSGFSGWRGCDSVSGRSCTITVYRLENKTVTVYYGSSPPPTSSPIGNTITGY